MVTPPHVLCDEDLRTRADLKTSTGIKRCKEGLRRGSAGSVKGSAMRGSVKGGCRPPVHERGTTVQACGQRILFTGPDGIGDYRARLSDFSRSIGTGPLSPEATGDLTYLYRAAPHTPAPLPKHCYVGGVGWAVEYGCTLNSITLLSNQQIKRAEFRSALENRTTDRYLNSWSASPRFLDWQQARSRGGLAWKHSVYDSYSHGNSKHALLSKRHEAQKEKAEESHLNAVTFPAITRAAAQ